MVQRTVIIVYFQTCSDRRVVYLLVAKHQLARLPADASIYRPWAKVHTISQRYIRLLSSSCIQVKMGHKEGEGFVCLKTPDLEETYFMDGPLPTAATYDMYVQTTTPTN
jgi:hypothetical protein